MNLQRRSLLSIAIILTSFITQAQSLFIGQDEDAIYNYFHVLKNDECRTYRNLAKPVGLSQNIDIFDLKGLSTSADNGSGSNCVKCILEDACLKEYFKNKPFDISLGISMNDNAKLQALTKGDFDKQINQFAEFLVQYPNVKFYLRIGYEFDGNWNNAYEDRRRYIVAYQRIHDIIRVKFEMKKATKNWFAVWQTCASPLDDIIENKFENLNDWYPGDKYVDFVGLSWYFAGSKVSPKYQNSSNPNFKRTQRGLANETIYFASNKFKPVMICESAPMGYNLTDLTRKNIHAEWDGNPSEKPQKLTALELWNDWYKPYFEFIARFKEQIKLVSYVNQNFESLPNFKVQKSKTYWGDSRIQGNDQISYWWKESWKF